MVTENSGIDFPDLYTKTILPIGVVNKIDTELEIFGTAYLFKVRIFGFRYGKMPLNDKHAKIFNYVKW